MSSPRFPRMFGKYALLRPFARGGMGEIYLAAHGDLGGAEKLCLVKKVPEDRDAPGLTARLLDEAKIAVRLNHTNLVQVFDAGQVDDELYIAMELIEGRDLRAVWNRTAERRSRIPLDVALYVAREIARGLEYAHGYGGLGLVHRDIAPPNILISFHGEVKITDFGLARSILKNEKTAPGIVYGRIAYLAPEQARGEQADARTDIFATGVILWELLTGRPLHDTGEDAVKNLDRARHPRIEAPSTLTRGLPAAVDAVSLKALAIDRASRYQTADDFRKAVAEELARIAPATDSSRVSSFLKDLFGDEIKREAAERERLLREELPKLRAARPTGEVRTIQPLSPLMRAPVDDPSNPETLLNRRPQAPAPPPLPGVRSVMERLPTGEAPRMPPPPPSISRMVPATVEDADEPDDEEPTMVPSKRSLTGPMAPPHSGGPRFATPTGPTQAAAALHAPVEKAERTEREDEAPAPEALVGMTVDKRYRIERVLGTGGMGAVYEAEHIEIGKKVALKVLHPQFSRQADLVARFRREARAASKVGHPNIVDVTDSGKTPNGDVYFVMERLDGLDLGEVLRHERRVAPDRTVAIGVQICRALSAAHAAGIIHRDLKPENIFLVSREGVPDFVKVLDFGIAKQDMGNQNSPRRLTTPGLAMGTPEYMAPEQAAGKAIDGRVDLYSVGAIMYEMLTGNPPHYGNNVMEILAKKATEAPAHPQKLNPEIPDLLADVVMRCLERDPDRRPQTMGALEYELNKAMKGRGSAVAAVLGLKSNDTGSMPVWAEESSAPRLFDSGAPPQPRRPSMPALPPVRTGQTGALPLSADEDKIRVNSARISSSDASSATVALSERRDPELRDARRAKKRPWGLIAGLVVIAAGAAAAAYKYARPATPAKKPATNETATATLERKQPKTSEPRKRAPDKDDEKMSPAEIDRMLEWARRCIEGGRVIAPPGDNLKELLDRIDHADPGNAQAEALRTKATSVIQRRGVLALKKNRLDEAQKDFEALTVLKPSDEYARGRLARTLSLRALRSLDKNRFAAALADATAALELNPEDTGTQLTVADVHLAIGKHELAAEEYQRVLDVKPADKRARLGLARATAPKVKPVKKRRVR